MGVIGGTGAAGALPPSRAAIPPGYFRTEKTGGAAPAGGPGALDRDRATGGGLQRLAGGGRNA
jgi:hypothetical protein